MTTLKPNKPSDFDGTRDLFEVNPWLYQVQDYLAPVQIDNPQALPDNVKIFYASSFFVGTASSWWYIQVAGNPMPEMYQEFEELMRAELITSDNVRRNKDKVKRMRKKGYVAGFVTEFRNVMMKIPDMIQGEKIDRFC